MKFSGPKKARYILSFLGRRRLPPYIQNLFVRPPARERTEKEEHAMPPDRPLPRSMTQAKNEWTRTCGHHTRKLLPHATHSSRPNKSLLLAHQHTWPGWITHDTGIETLRSMYSASDHSNGSTPLGISPMSTYPTKMLVNAHAVHNASLLLESQRELVVYQQ